jgi:methionine-gamma-lyase
MPIYQTSTFVFANSEQGARRFKGEEGGYIYTRLGNPNTDVLARKVAILEGFEAGLTVSSGMASLANVILVAARAGDHIVVDDTVYGGTDYLVEDDIRRLGIDVTRLDASEPEAVADAMKPNTTLVLVETPANPTLKVIDIAAIAEIAHRKNALLCVDNTFMTPYCQKPKDFGADIVCHSATKYISGHGDVVAGVLVGEKAFVERAYTAATHYGWTLAPINAWLVLRGLKTLALRMERSCANALAIAQWLEMNQAIERVHYPSLKSHPQYELAGRQQKSGGGIIAFEMRKGYDAGRALMDNVKLCTLAVSLGDCDTLIQHPASMTHAGMSQDALREAHIAPGLVRLSVGIEHVDDIIEDLDQAIRKY